MIILVSFLTYLTATKLKKLLIVKDSVNNSSPSPSPSTSNGTTTLITEPASLPPPHRVIRVLLGLTGSVASIKAPLLVPLLQEKIIAKCLSTRPFPNSATTATSTTTTITTTSTNGTTSNEELNQLNSTVSVEVKVISTKPALHFVDKSKMTVPILTDDDEWSSWTKMGDNVLHIDLRSWADIFIIAPLDANTMAKLSYGLSDNMITCVVRAWDFSVKPLIVCPAMNTLMWSHPHTATHMQMLKDLGMVIIPPIAKRLACGDVGLGAMAEVQTIAEAAADIVSTLDLAEIDKANWRATGKMI